MIKLTCPRCSKRIGLDSHVDGEPCECPYCESVFVPAEQTVREPTTSAVIPLDDANPRNADPCEPRVECRYHGPIGHGDGNARL